MSLLESLAGRPVPLLTAGCRDWQRLRAAVVAAPTKAALGRAEDSIDAVVCAYVARLAVARPAAVRVLGTAAEGYIVVPVTPALAARMDAAGPLVPAGQPRDRGRGRISPRAGSAAGSPAGPAAGPAG